MLVAPVDLTFSPDRSDCRFIVDQTGLVLILTPEGPDRPRSWTSPTGWSFSRRSTSAVCLALAFHPRFARNGKLYVQYSAAQEGPNICVGEDGRVPGDPGGCPLQYTRRVSEFRVLATDPNRVDPSTERVVFKMQSPAGSTTGVDSRSVRTGCCISGWEYGGFVHGPSGADDPFNVDPELLFGDLVAQDLTSLYGKILRIDVDRGDRYGIPPDNPFVGRDGFPPEIYAWGFRNPFRISFDREGDRAMYVSAPADTLFEATYKVTGPGNHGWAVKEGTHCIVRTSAFAPPETLTCSSDAQCPSGPQVSMCGRKGVCTCPRVGPLGERIRSPVIEYLNFAGEDPGHGFLARGSVGPRWAATSTAARRSSGCGGGSFRATSR